MLEPATDAAPSEAKPVGALMEWAAGASGHVRGGVDWVDTEPEALAYIAEFGITYLNGPDVGTHLGQAFRIQGVPETLIIDKHGRVRWVKIGPLYPPELTN